MTGVVETFIGGVHLATPHSPDEYPGVKVVRPGQWEYAVIVPSDGQTFAARGGEWVPGYRLRSGIEAQGFTLGPGDEVTRLRADLPGSLAEWRVRRA